MSAFLQVHGLKHEFLTTAKTKQVDGLLEAFVGSLHQSRARGALRIAKHGVLYIQAARPSLKKKLPATWAVLRSWEEQQPSAFRAPLPLPLLAVMVVEARRMAMECQEKKQQELWLTFATLMMVGFFSLLRPGELCSLTRKDISLPNAWALAGPFAVIKINQPKNKRQLGAQQFCELRHPDALAILASAIT